MRVGSHHSEETKRKMREKANREPRDPEICEKIAFSKLHSPHPYRGKRLSKEHRENISLGMRKRKQEMEATNVESGESQ